VKTLFFFYSPSLSLVCISFQLFRYCFFQITFWLEKGRFYKVTLRFMPFRTVDLGTSLITLILFRVTILCAMSGSELYNLPASFVISSILLRILKFRQ
jgi:hypothetical protein